MTTTLTGSEKQIAWAASLRDEAITFLNVAIADLESVLAGELVIDDSTRINITNAGYGAKAQFLLDYVTAKRDTLAAITEAGAIIDQRKSLPVWSDFLAENHRALMQVWNDYARTTCKMIVDLANGSARDSINMDEANKLMANRDQLATCRSSQRVVLENKIAKGEAIRNAINANAAWNARNA